MGVWECFCLSWRPSVTSLRALGHSSGKGFIRTLLAIALGDKHASRNEKHSVLNAANCLPSCKVPLSAAKPRILNVYPAYHASRTPSHATLNHYGIAVLKTSQLIRFPRMVIQSQSSTTVLKSFSEPATKSTNPLSSPPRPASLSPSRLRPFHLDPSPSPQPQTATRRTCSAHSAAYSS